MASKPPAATAHPIVDRPWVLRGKRAGLKSLHREDIPTACRWFQNLEMITYLGLRRAPMTVEMETAYYETALKGEPDILHMAIFDIASNTCVGSVSLKDISPNNYATLGICIGDPAFWGKGLGSEAARLMVEFGMFYQNLYNVRLHVFGFNERARRSYLKAGFREVGRIRGVIVLGGERHDDIVMDITRDEVDLSRMRSMIRLLDPATARRPAR